MINFDQEMGLPKVFGMDAALLPLGSMRTELKFSNTLQVGLTTVIYTNLIRAQECCLWLC